MVTIQKMCERSAFAQSRKVPVCRLQTLECSLRTVDLYKNA